MLLKVVSAMSNLKMFEITLEATDFDGHQVFACYAVDKRNALLKLKSGDCDIIESNVEVIGLNDEPVDIIESSDISSRLSSDISYIRGQRIATLEAALTEAHRVILHELDNGRTPYLLPVDNGGKGLGYFEDVLAGIKS